MNNDKKLTAVQMAFEKLAQQGLLVIDDYENLNVYHEAKAMEEEQIINTWSEATAPDHEIGLSDAFYIISQVQKAEQYYNKTYKQE
jgi:hypothetical protein